jgi:copper homeostasis protein
VDLILEVIALGAADARAARDGGADRVELVAGMDHDGLIPGAGTFAAVRAAVDLPVRVMLRDQAGYALSDPAGLRARDLRAAGAEEFVLGFLDQAGAVDRAAAGIRAFHTGSAVRPGGRWDAPVDPALVAGWRARLDPGPPG